MKLFPHNQEAFDSAVRMFKRENRVCIIQPTGTGKSVVIAEFVNKNPSKRHLLLAPGSHIFSEIQKHVKNVEIEFATYIGLKRKEPFFIKNSFDYIYLDEFHRLGAEVWGGAVKRLLRLNPRAKVLGTSATPIRYLDDNRNMATEIFKDQIATQMSLISAIAKGILPSPTYISALYSIQDEYRQMRKKVMASKLKDKETLLRDLDSKVIDWEKSSGLDTVLRKYLSTERRRVIVFCKDWKHLQYAKKLLDPIFGKIYGRIEALSLYSKRKIAENETYLRAFRAENESAIVLYTIDKINEGLHSKSCNTVILLRDTISPIVFSQQIGRAFSIKPTNNPLIIDLVNNFKNIQLASIKSDSERELNLLSKGSQVGNVEKRKETITFIDETQDIRKIFSSFDEEINVWKSLYEKAKVYFKEHGHLYVPPVNRELYDWVRFQRYSYQNRHMSKERAILLTAIGMEFENKIPAGWMTMLCELEEWIKENGTLPPISASNRVGAWVNRQRMAFKRGTLIKEQIDILRKLVPLGDDVRSLKINARVNRLIAHFKKGNIDTADERIKHDLARIIALYKLKKLSKSTLTSLRKGRVAFETSFNERAWLERVKKLIEWFESNGTLPKRNENLVLYQFCIKERKYLKRGHPFSEFIQNDKDARKLYKKVKKLISMLGVKDWDERLSELKRVVAHYGFISKSNCEDKLLQWTWKQQRDLRDGKLSSDKIEKLLTIKEINWHGRNRRHINKS